MICPAGTVGEYLFVKIRIEGLREICAGCRYEYFGFEVVVYAEGTVYCIGTVIVLEFRDDAEVGVGECGYVAA